MSAPGDLPRIAIERTPANDVYLILASMGMGEEAQRVLADPLRFLRDHRTEARFVSRYLQGLLADQPAPAAREEAGFAAPAGRGSTALRRSEPLLR